MGKGEVPQAGSNKVGVLDSMRFPQARFASVEGGFEHRFSSNVLEVSGRRDPRTENSTHRQPGRPKVSCSVIETKGPEAPLFESPRAIQAGV
jgi:hypothetical protein